MAKGQQAQVVITANAAVAKKIMDELRQRVEQLKQKMDALDVTTKEGKAEFAKLEKELISYNSAITQNISNTERIKHAVDNLSKTSLRDLKRALSAAKTEMGKFSENTDPKRVQQLREQMRALQNQIKLLEGEYVNIRKHIGHLDTVSTQWLNKAIAQQQQVLTKTKEGTMEYARQKATLDQLQAAQSRRAMDTVTTNKTASASQLQEARQVLVARRDSMASNDVKGIAQMNQAIAEADERLSKINGKIKETGISWQKMRKVLSSPNNATGEDIKQTMDAIQQKIAKLPADSKRVAALREQYKLLDQTLKGTKMSQQQLNDILTRAKTGKASIDELKRAYKQLEDELQHIKVSDAGFKQKQKDAQRLKKQIDEVTGAAQKQGGAWQTAMRNLVAYVGLFGAFNILKQKLQDVVNLNLSFSDRLADIRKVSGLAIGDINRLAVALSKIDTRTSIEELNQIAYAGAKLGMGKYGTEGLEGFVKAANQVNVALKEDLGEEALTALSKITEVMGLIPRMGVDKAMLATGSAMFKLASTSTATSANIVEFSKRLTGIARTAGITTDQLLALGSASDSMMLMPEVASTAFSKLITQLQRNPAAIEKSLAMPEGTIKKYFEAGNAMQAIVEILSAMKNKGNMSALNDVFKDLGSDGARLIAVMVTMAKNVDMLQSHLAESKSAFSEASAVTQEYNIQQNTANALMERAGNIWEKAFVNPEGVDVVKQFAQAWYDFAKSATSNEQVMGALKFALQSVLDAARALLEVLPFLLVGLGARGMFGLFSMFVGILPKVVYFLSNFRKEWALLNVAMKANIFIAVATAIWTIGTYVYRWATATKEAIPFMNGFTKSLRDYNAECLKATNSAANLINSIKRTNVATKERSALINQFNKQYGQYMSNLLKETATTKDLAKAYREVYNEMRNRIGLKMKEQDYEKYVNPAVGWMAERYASYDEFTKTNSRAKNISSEVIRGIVQDMIQKNGGTSLQTVMSYINKQYGFNYSASGLNALINSSNNIAKDDPVYNQQIKYIAAAVAQDIAVLNRTQQVEKKWAFLKPPKEAPAELPGTLDDTPTATDKTDTSQADAKAFLESIKAYYTRQMNAWKEDFADMGYDQAMQEEILANVQTRMRMALDAAKQQIVYGKKTWDEFKTTMSADEKEKLDELGQSKSRDLLEKLQSTDLMDIRKRLLELKPKIKKGKVVGSKDNYRDEIFLDKLVLSLSEDEAKMADIALKQHNERMKILLENQYTGKVDDQYRNEFESLGFSPFSESQMEILKKGGDDAVEFIRQRMADVTHIFGTARVNIGKLYETNGDRDAVLKLLYGDDYEAQLSGSTISGLLSMQSDDFEAFYMKLIEYSDKWDEARKREEERTKKLAKDRMERSSAYRDLTSAEETTTGKKSQEDMYGTWGKSAGVQFGMDVDYENDPEVLLMQLRVQKAQMLLDMYKQMGLQGAALADQEKVLAEAQLAYTQAIVNNLKEQYKAFNEWASPVQDAAWELGEVLATTYDSVEERQAAMRSIAKSIATSWAKTLMQLMQTNLQERIMMAQHYAELQAMQQTFGTAKIAIAQSQGVQMNAVQSAQNTTEVTQEGAKETAKVSLNSAGWFAKVMSQLGWPLGPIVAAAGMATIGAVLSWAISKAFGGKKDNNTEAKNDVKIDRKLVSGMLTYDEGNVQTVVGSDGNIYNARSVGSIPDGVTYVTQPIATSVNGAPGLVAERGPEIVIGRKTTKAMRMNNPALLQAILNYDHNRSSVHHVYDDGNAGNVSMGADNAMQSDANNFADLRTTMMQMSVLLQKLDERLSKPIQASMNMYGPNGAYEDIKKAQKFMGRYGR